MLIPYQLVPATSALAATFAWGMRRLCRGYASRKANAFLLTTITHLSGTTVMLVLALLFHSHFPAEEPAVGGGCGVIREIRSCGFLPRAFAGEHGADRTRLGRPGSGHSDPHSGFTQGLPGAMQVAGFLLAGIGIWLISRSEGMVGRPKGIGTAMVAGVGFAGYFLCIHQAGNASVFWLAGTSRFVSLLTTGAIVLATRQFGPMDSAGVVWGLVAGVLDISGSALFIVASQRGRLDAAVVISSLYPAITVLLARIFCTNIFHGGESSG